MNIQSVSNDTITFCAGVLSWIIVDLVANLLLRQSKTGASIRFIGARWLKRQQAIEVALIQFAVAFGLSFFLQDFFANLFSQTYSYIMPIFLSTLGFLYLYILGNLPYKVTLKRTLPSIILIILASLLFYAIWYFVGQT